MTGFSTFRLIAMAALVTIAACAEEEPSGSAPPVPIEPVAQQRTSQVRGILFIDSAERLPIATAGIDASVKERIRIIGNLPTLCASAAYNIERKGLDVNIDVFSMTNEGKVCAQALKPFEISVPLEISPRQGGVYTVNGEKLNPAPAE